MRRFMLFCAAGLVALQLAQSCPVRAEGSVHWRERAGDWLVMRGTLPQGNHAGTPFCSAERVTTYGLRVMVAVYPMLNKISLVLNRPGSRFSPGIVDIGFDGRRLRTLDATVFNNMLVMDVHDRDFLRRWVNASTMHIYLRDSSYDVSLGGTTMAHGLIGVCLGEIDRDREDHQGRRDNGRNGEGRKT